MAHHLYLYLYLLGDTHVDVFEKNPIIFNSPEIIVECTFFHDEKGIVERANRDGHIHWNSLKPSIFMFTRFLYYDYLELIIFSLSFFII